MKFSKKKIGSFPTYSEWKDLLNKKFLIKTVVILASVFVIVWLGKYALTWGKQAAKTVTVEAVKAVGQKMSEPMLLDDFGHINVLLVGYAGETRGNRGGLLTDTIMVASYNPQVGAVTFLSIPRDLYVAYENGYTGRINAIFPNTYAATEGDYDAASIALRNKVEEITGVPIHYYMAVDFDGFVEFINNIGGIDVVVPETIHDPYYPGPNNSYQTFHIDAGEQVLSGDVALKFARSRKTTSDFSRSHRQQLIIEAIIKKMIGSFNLFNLDETKKIYEMAMEVIKTNISFKQMLGLTQYIDQQRQYFSFGYTYECDLRYIDYTEPGCVLVPGIREQFGGAAVIIPSGATPGNLSYYKKTQDFAFRVVYNQQFLMERAEITVLNGIDKDRARAEGYNSNGVANDISIDLNLKGFDVVDIGNTEEFYDETVIYVPGDGWYPHTTETLRAFVDYARVEGDPAYGSGVTIVLGYDYVKNL